MPTAVARYENASIPTLTEGPDVVETKVTPGQRRQMIAEAAYFRAERRGFVGGDPVRDWCEAEAEVDEQLRRREVEQLLARIEEGLDAAGKKLGAVRRKVARLSAEARQEWQRDIDRLAHVRDGLKPKLAELRERGEQAGVKLRHQAEVLRAEMAELVDKLARRAAH